MSTGSFPLFHVPKLQPDAVCKTGSGSSSQHVNEVFEASVFTVCSDQEGL